MTNINKSVELNRDNINRCLCTVCPVQTDSKCSKDKLDIINEKLKDKEWGGTVGEERIQSEVWYRK